jgi:methylenetetrahydrofolate reductase (NADPH)
MTARVAVSFEFFPPKTEEGESSLWNAIRALEGLAPQFVSVTYGAGGSARDRTVRLTERIALETTLKPMGHLTCVGSSVEELRSVIGAYAAAGVGKILALRGDPPRDSNQPGAVDEKWRSHPGGLKHAVELVELVRSLGNFEVGVAAFPEGHPESRDFAQDIEVLVKKQQAGASFAITQIFFHVRDYVRLVESSNRAGVTMPIIPGVMPITNVSQIKRFAELSGADFPKELAARFEHVADDEAKVVRLGVEVATAFCKELLAVGAPALHFYTLNRSTSAREVYQALQSS